MLKMTYMQAAEWMPPIEVEVISIGRQYDYVHDAALNVYRITRGSRSDLYRVGRLEASTIVFEGSQRLGWAATVRRDA